MIVIGGRSGGRPRGGSGSVDGLKKKKKKSSGNGLHCSVEIAEGTFHQEYLDTMGDAHLCHHNPPVTIV